MAVVFLWDQRNQLWRYHLPGRQPVDSVDIPWFNTLSPRDTVFIYNLNTGRITVSWF